MLLALERRSWNAPSVIAQSSAALLRSPGVDNVLQDMKTFRLACSSGDILLSPTTPGRGVSYGISWFARGAQVGMCETCLFGSCVRCSCCMDPWARVRPGGVYMYDCTYPWLFWSNFILISDIVWYFFWTSKSALDLFEGSLRVLLGTMDGMQPRKHWPPTVALTQGSWMFSSQQVGRPPSAWNSHSTGP